jgi:hypothetical protein
MVIPTYTDLIQAQEFKFLASTDGDRIALINEFLVNAARQVSPKVYGSIYGRRVALLAVHRLILRDRAAQTEAEAGAELDPELAFRMPAFGAVSSISGSHGSSSVSFQVPKAGKDGETEYYGQTEFGLEYYSTRRTPTGFVSAAQSFCGC